MFGFLYHGLWRLAALLLPVVSFFSKKIRIWSAARNIGQKPLFQTKKFWFHCASVGEYEMALPLISSLIQKHGIDAILITFFSPSGYNYAIGKEYQSVVMYLPKDTAQEVSEFYARYRPQIAVLVRYELWYNLLKIGLSKGVKFYLINARFGNHHFLFKSLGKPYQKLLHRFSHIFASDQVTATLLKHHGFNNISFVGDTRYDRVFEITKTKKSYPILEQFKNNLPLVVLGSSWPTEEQWMADFLEKNKTGVKTIVAPHDISPDRIQTVANTFKNTKAIIYTEIGDRDTSQYNVLILNTMGMLSSVYQYADVAFVGGGFSGALHNIIEPGIWGCALTYGGNTDKFPEAKDFVNAGAAFIAQDSDSWAHELKAILNSPKTLATMKEKAKIFSAGNLGASQKILSLLTR